WRSCTCLVLHVLSRRLDCYFRPCIPFFCNAPATTEIYTLSLHDALPISRARARFSPSSNPRSRSACTSAKATSLCPSRRTGAGRSEEHTSELQSLRHLVCRLLLEKKNRNQQRQPRQEYSHGSSNYRRGRL